MSGRTMSGRNEIIERTVKLLELAAKEAPGKSICQIIHEVTYDDPERLEGISDIKLRELLGYFIQSTIEEKRRGS